MMSMLLDSVVGLPQASTFAADVDSLFGFIFWFSVIGLLAVTIALIYFMIKYNRSKVKESETPYIDGHTSSETAVAVFLLLITLVMFAWGWRDYKKMIYAPANAMDINVIGRQWLWQFEYTNGRKMTNEVVVPMGRPIRLLMGSADVLHSFFVPAFRVKQDLVPGAYTTLWFEAKHLGEFDVLCAEYCGTAHSKMLAKVKVVEPAEYDKWQKRWEIKQILGESESASKSDESKPTETLSERGKRAFAEKGCTACHSSDGSKIIGPSVKGIFGSERTFTDGSKTKADENYLRKSLMDPQEQIVEGYQPIMPTFRGVLSDEEINAIIGYIKSLE